jgi:hypothetical protein
MNQIVEQFVKDINNEMSKLIPKTWNVIFPIENQITLNVKIYPFKISDYNTDFVYKFSMQDIKQLFVMSKYNANVSKEEKEQCLKKATKAAYNKLSNWVNKEQNNPSQNTFALFIAQKIQKDLGNDWKIRPYSDDKKVYNKIYFEIKNQHNLIPIDVDYIKFARGSKAFIETSNNIKKIGTKKTKQLINNEKRTDIFEFIQENIIDKEALKDEEKVSNDILSLLGDANNMDANMMKDMSQKNIESIIFGED